MTRWRVGVALLLFVVVVLPVTFPFLELITHPEAWRVWSEAGRLGSLALNTLALVGGTLAIVLPLGIGGAVLLYRSDLPGSYWLRFVVLLSLFVPLPLFTAAWQAALGTTGWLPTMLWNELSPENPEVAPDGVFWNPLGSGFGPAIWLQAMAGLPWVILIVGQALVWVERELEEDMLTVVGPWRVLWSVTLPRCRVAIGAAGLWIGLQATTEITITDMMQVRTIAEEVYGQFVVGDEDALAHAVTTSLPATLLACVLVLWIVQRWDEALPPLETLSPPHCLVQLGRFRWLLFAIVLSFVTLLAVIPVVSLVWKAGLAGSPTVWSPKVTMHHLLTVVPAHGLMIAESIGLAALAGIVTAAIGVLTCWLARESRWFRVLGLGLMAISWAISGPIIGIGVNKMIAKILDVTDPEWLAVALYHGPSPLPALWVQVIRFLPCAIALLWPVVRLVPADILDAARVDGAGPGNEFRHVVLPLTVRSCAWAALAVAILALGEVSAGKIVKTPGSQTFAQEVFSQMHYGVSPDLAAMCLLLLGIIIAAGAIVLAASRRVGWNSIRSSGLPTTGTP
jgi:iron(III) transport system permease protein